MKIIILLVLGFLAVSFAEEEQPTSTIEDKGLFVIFDKKGGEHTNNTVNHEEFNKFIKEHEYYQFGESDFYEHTHGYLNDDPLLIVYHPFEDVSGLEGHYLKGGLNSFFYGKQEDDPESKWMRNYIFSGLVEAVTPAAAAQAYPSFYRFKLKDIGNKKLYEIPEDFQVLFVAPISRRHGNLDDLDITTVVEYNRKVTV